MTERLNNIDELFRSGLKDYAPAPPESVWESIENKIVAGKRRVVLPLFLKIAAGIVLLAGISWFLWKSLNPSPQEQVLSEKSLNANPDEKSAPDAKPYVETDDTPVTTNVTADNSENNTPIIAEVAAPTITEDPAVSSEEQKTEASPPETFAANESFTPRKPRETIISSDPDSEEDENPLIKTNNPVANKNELIIKQNLLALEEQQKNQRNGLEWSIGGQAGPQYTYRNVQVNTPVYPVDNFDDYESGILAYSGGFQFEVEPAHRFSVQSGIYYSKMGQTKATLQSNTDISVTYSTNMEVQTQPSRTSEIPDIVNSTGVITFDKTPAPPVTTADENIDWTVGLVTAEQYFEFVEIPFIFRYLVVDRKVDVRLCSGLWANFLVGNKTIAAENTDLQQEGETQQINSFNYSGSVSIGLGYPLAKNIDISFEPFFKYYLSPFNTNPETDVYPYSIGILTGVSYSF